MKIKALVLCPSPAGKGGVSDYNRVLGIHFRSERVTLDFRYTGSLGEGENAGQRISKSFLDYFTLLGKMAGYDLVILNPSLDTKALIRDAIYHFVAKRVLAKKTLVVFHGWSPEVAKIIDGYGKLLFRGFFNFDRALVLGTPFKEALVRWGTDPAKVTVETTFYEEHRYDEGKDRFKVLFLSRFAKGKGCLEAVRTVEMLAGEFPRLELYMAGDGELKEELMAYVAEHKLAGNVTFCGWVQGEKKRSLLDKCGILLLPTSYGEGLPIAMVEAMGAGMAIVTRPAGGIPDVFDDGENGFIVTTCEPADFAAKMRMLLESEALWRAVSARNRQKALETFEARCAVKRLEKVYYEVASGGDGCG